MMTIKILGAFMIILSCGSFGFILASNYKREVKTLKKFISALDYMECELQFRLCPLPELCRMTSSETEGVLKDVFLSLSQELEDQVSPDVRSCVRSVLSRITNLPHSTAECVRLLGDNLGRFDLQGQLKGLDGVRSECRVKLNKLCGNSEVRIRSYQTIGLCAGAAIVILLV